MTMYSVIWPNMALYEDHCKGSGLAHTVALKCYEERSDRALWGAVTEEGCKVHWGVLFGVTVGVWGTVWGTVWYCIIVGGTVVLLGGTVWGYSGVLWGVL